MRDRRILRIGLLTATLLVTMFVLVNAFLHLPAAPPSTAAWIPLPTPVLGQTDADSRWLLWYANNRPAETNLAVHCGNPVASMASDIQLDTYSIYTTESWDQPYLHATLRVQPSMMEVKLEMDAPPPQELLPPPGYPPFTPDRRGKVIVRSIPKEQMEPIRIAWASDALWFSPAYSHAGWPPLVLDGHTTFMEACVSGQYAARKHDSGSDEAARLWQLLHALSGEGTPAGR